MLTKIAGIACNQPLGIACYGKFHQVIVCFIPKVWSPPIIDIDPLASRNKSIKQGFALICCYGTGGEHMLPRHDVFVFRIQGIADQWLYLPQQTAAQQCPWRGVSLHQGGNENIGVDNGGNHAVMIADMLSVVAMGLMLNYLPIRARMPVSFPNHKA